MALHHVTSFDSNPQGLPTPEPRDVSGSLPLKCSFEMLPRLARRALPCRLLLLPEELKLEIANHLVEKRAVHRRVWIKQGAYQKRVMVLRASHYRESSALLVSKDFTALVNIHYYQKTLFTFDFAPSRIPSWNIRHMQPATRSRLLHHMPWHRPTIHTHVKCHKDQLTSSMVEQIRHIAICFSIFSDVYTPGNIIASNHTAMINVTHAVHAITAFGIRRHIFKSVAVQIKIHQSWLLDDSEELNLVGGFDGLLGDMRKTFLVHNNDRGWWRLNPSTLRIKYV